MSGARVSAGEAPVGVCQAGSTFVILMGGKFAVDVLVTFWRHGAGAGPAAGWFAGPSMEHLGKGREQAICIRNQEDSDIFNHQPVASLGFKSSSCAAKGTVVPNPCQI